MTTENLTHIGFIVLGLAALLALGLSAIKFIRAVQKNPESGKKTWKGLHEAEIANLREELLAHIQLLSEKLDQHNEIILSKFKNQDKRLLVVEKRCNDRPCEVEQ